MKLRKRIKARESFPYFIVFLSAKLLIIKKSCIYLFIKFQVFDMETTLNFNLPMTFHQVAEIVSSTLAL